MKTDRELLELAAKAAGIGNYWRHVDDLYQWEQGSYIINWNPLTDDGDALRLAVSLEIEIISSEKYRVSCADTKETSHAVRHESDPYAATRRAIVRAAAEIGESL